jgi:hypothetical protein
MEPVMIHTATVMKLFQAGGPVPLCDLAGRIIGQFIPATPMPDPADFDPDISEEELDRLEREEYGRGRPLADILADLERLAEAERRGQS